MGYFDESDEEGESARAKTQKAASGDDSVEEDPLDAYMKTLDNGCQEVSQGPAKKARLDVDNDDEIGWGERKLAPRIGCQIEEVDDLSEPETVSTQKRVDNFPVPASVRHSTVHFPKRFWEPEDTEAGRRWREEQDVAVTVSVDPILDFSKLTVAMGGSDLMQTEILAAGFVKPTLVQSQTNETPNGPASTTAGG